MYTMNVIISGPRDPSAPPAWRSEGRPQGVFLLVVSIIVITTTTTTNDNNDNSIIIDTMTARSARRRRCERPGPKRIN